MDDPKPLQGGRARRGTGLGKQKVLVLDWDTWLIRGLIVLLLVSS